ncbi:MAG: ribosome assembly cofactor RimP [Rikenellaceae bacterium]|nr:ribosome assembly cofactor RimP [Rikenellaceae bacterium]
MIDCEKILAIAERELEGTDLFTVSCKCSPSNEVELLIDSDTHVTIERCAELSRTIEAEFDRDEEDFSLTVASAGIGSELKNIRQYRKLIGQSVEVLLLSGVKVLAKLDEVTDEGITISYEEKQTVEGKKRKVLVEVSRTYSFDQIKYTKEYLDFK